MGCSMARVVDRDTNRRTRHSWCVVYLLAEGVEMTREKAAEIYVNAGMDTCDAIIAADREVIYAAD